MQKHTPSQLVGMAEWPFIEWKKQKNKKRAIHYARVLQEVGMKDVDIKCLLTDLYWDAFDEAGHPGKYTTRDRANVANN